MPEISKSSFRCSTSESNTLESIKLNKASIQSTMQATLNHLSSFPLHFDKPKTFLLISASCRTSRRLKCQIKAWPLSLPKCPRARR